MTDRTFQQELHDRIETKYRERGDTLGWRLLYSPPHVLDAASIAFIGLNPGGDFRPDDHAEFAMSAGSAYTTESWGGPPGEAKLQRQVRALFQRLDVRPEDVLAGNLVPFRTPAWDAMSGRRDALAFGKALWTDILRHAQPRLVIAMGGLTIETLAEVLKVRDLENIPVGWGNVTGKRGHHARGPFVGLPHLSRFAIIGRPESEPGLQRLLQV